MASKRSATLELFAQLATLESSAEVSEAFENMFSAHSQSWVTNLRTQLANIKKGSMMMVVYFSKMTTIK